MKKLLLTAALMLGTTTLATAAEPDASIFAANGCDVATLVPVMSELNPGEVLYWQNTNGGGCVGKPDNHLKPTILDRLREIAEANRPPVGDDEEPADPKS